MKKLAILSSSLVALMALFSSCDKVDCPFDDGCDGTTDSGRIIYDDSLSVAPQDQYRVVLLEEFTGHTCTVCPDGAREVERLLDVYGDSLIAVGVHAGTFA